MFKDAFKYYKSRNPPPNFKNVIDFEKADSVTVKKLVGHSLNEYSEHKLGLIPVEQWTIYEVIDVPGLIFIKNPFTHGGQKYWITKCLKDYSRKPNKLNIDAHNLLNNDESWWDICFQFSDRGKSLLPKLRWATLGYHHDWDTKLYSEDSKTEMPNELADLTEILAKALGFSRFKAEAAIVNYYRMNSTLAGHTDHSEVNVTAPLFSISFGQTAVFLIGGHAAEDPATALFLRSGDVIVMSGDSRLRYHGVPKILPAKTLPWETKGENYETNSNINPADWQKAKTYIAEARININVRQVLQPGQNSLY